MAKTDGYMIERAALIRAMEEIQAAACDGTENDGSDGTTRVEYPVPITTQEVVDLIANLEAVELTRCKNCERWKAEEGQTFGKCENWSVAELPGLLRAVTHMTGPDDFCSDAQRRIYSGIDIRG